MRKTYLFYGLITLAVVALITGVISYATKTHPTQKEARQIPVKTTMTTVTSTEKKITPIVKKKSCGCCAERRERIQKIIQQARVHREAKQQTLNEGTP